MKDTNYWADIELHVDIILHEIMLSETEPCVYDLTAAEPEIAFRVPLIVEKFLEEHRTVETDLRAGVLNKYIDHMRKHINANSNC